MKNKTLKKFIDLLYIFVIYIISQFTVAIPIKLFNINISDTSIRVKALLNLFPGVFLSILLYFIYRKELEKEFKFFKDYFKNYMETILKHWIIGMALMSISNIIIIKLSPIKQAANEVSIRGFLNASPFIALLSIIIIAPFTEELLFRKAIRKIINNKYLFVFISGLVFGLMHIVGSYKSPYDLIFTIPYGVLGGTFALLYYKTNNIFAPMLAHFFHNTFVVTILLLSFMRII